MTPQQQTVLHVTQEECAEVVQAIAKVFRFGLAGDYNGQSNLQRLEQELGDLQCMIDLMMETGIVSAHNICTASERKREKLRQWSNIFDDSDD